MRRGAVKADCQSRRVAGAGHSRSDSRWTGLHGPPSWCLRGSAARSSDLLSHLPVACGIERQRNGRCSEHAPLNRSPPLQDARTQKSHRTRCIVWTSRSLAAKRLGRSSELSRNSTSTWGTRLLQTWCGFWRRTKTLCCASCLRGRGAALPSRRSLRRTTWRQCPDGYLLCQSGDRTNRPPSSGSWTRPPTSSKSAFSEIANLTLEDRHRCLPHHVAARLSGFPNKVSLDQDGAMGDFWTYLVDNLRMRFAFLTAHLLRNLRVWWLCSAGVTTYTGHRMKVSFPTASSRCLRETQSSTEMPLSLPPYTRSLASPAQCMVCGVFRGKSTSSCRLPPSCPRSYVLLALRPRWLR